MGRYRGGLPRVGSVDATHITNAQQGFNVTSSLFESMCDDGSNQRGSSSRLSGVKDNGDGTTTLYFKGMVTSTQKVGGDILVEIAFDNVGTKRLMLKFAAAQLIKL